MLEGRFQSRAHTPLRLLPNISHTDYVHTCILGSHTYIHRGGTRRRETQYGARVHQEIRWYSKSKARGAEKRAAGSCWRSVCLARFDWNWIAATSYHAARHTAGLPNRRAFSSLSSCLRFYPTEQIRVNKTHFKTSNPRARSTIEHWCNRCARDQSQPI